MIDFTISKIVVSMLVLFLVASSILYFTHLNEVGKESKARAIVRFVASKINEVGSKEIETAVILTFNGTYTSLPPKVGDEYYSLFIGGTSVRIVLKRYSTFLYTSVPVHAFSPDVLSNYHYNLTSEVLKGLDLKYPYIEVNCQPFVIENRRILVDGIYYNHVFVYLLEE